MVKLLKLMKRWQQAHEAHGWVVKGGDDANRASCSERDEIRAAASLPTFTWCRFGNDEFERRTSNAGLIKQHCRTWKRSLGSAVLCGPTGVGKTLCLIALAHRLIDRLARPLGDEAARFVRRVRFVRASELVKAVDRFPLGHGEPPLITRSVYASLLLLDDVGNEGPDRSSTLFEVLDRRYMASAATIITTYLDQAQLQQRYGDALLRRLTDQGKYVTTTGKL